MKKKIHRQLISIALIAIAATLILCVGVFYELFQKQVMEDLQLYAEAMVVFVEDEDFLDEVEQAELKNIRITLIESDGTVVYDSDADSTEMENHRERPEVANAFEQGSGSDIRKSETVGANTYYYALQVDGTQVLRVSREASSIWSIFISALPAIAVVTLLIFGVCLLLAQFLTKSIVRPIEEMAENIDNMMEIRVYPELKPFINTIHSQHEDIIKNARMRQEFTANVSHELKTPLTAISGYSELIETGLASDEDIERFAGEIHKNSSRLLTLINDIIRLSELDSEATTSGNFARVDLYQLAEDCVSMLQINAEQHDVILRIEGYSCLVLADRQMMDELIYNLCDNAIRYNNPGGMVVVRVSRNGEEIVLSVWDTGIGIPKQHQDRIFERFYRVDKSRSKSTGGTGLGLAIVKHIVAQHYARIEVDSEEGIGTEIRVFFPKPAAAERLMQEKTEKITEEK